MFFETRKRSKFVPATLRVDFMSRLRCVLAGAPASEQGKKQLTKRLMASASCRFLFETIEPRVLLSADLAPGATVHKPDAFLDAHAVDVRELSAASVAQVYPNVAQVYPNQAADVAAASFRLQVEGAGNAVGTYQFLLPGPPTATVAGGSPFADPEPTYDPSHPTLPNL